MLFAKDIRKMVNSLRSQVGLMRAFWGWKTPEIGVFTRCNFYLRHPFLSRFTDACKAVFVPGIHVVHVPQIHRIGHISEIGNSIIRPVPVNVVDLILGPVSVHVKPSKAMCGMALPINADTNVTLVTDCLGNLSSKSLSGASATLPSEQPSVWVVVKQCLQMLLRQRRIKISHAVSPVKKWFGQRPASVSALSGLRYFIPALSFAQRQTPNVSDRLRLAICQWASPRLTGFFRPQWGTFSHS